MALYVPYPFTLEASREFGAGNHMIDTIGLEPLLVSPDKAEASMIVLPRHLAPNGYLHAGVVTLFADVTCGMGSFAALPGPEYFITTIDTATNYFGTARDGKLVCTATARHIGRRTQVWDADVRSVEQDKIIAAFRCTQMVMENR